MLMYIYIHVHIRIHIHIYICIYIYVYSDIYVHIHVYLEIERGRKRDAYTYMDTYLHIHIYIYVYYIYIHILKIYSFFRFGNVCDLRTHGIPMASRPVRSNLVIFALYQGRMHRHMFREEGIPNTKGTVQVGHHQVHFPIGEKAAEGLRGPGAGSAIWQNTLESKGM